MHFSVINLCYTVLKFFNVYGCIFMYICTLYYYYNAYLCFFTKGVPLSAVPRMSVSRLLHPYLTVCCINVLYEIHSQHAHRKISADIFALRAHRAVYDHDMSSWSPAYF